MTLKQGHPHVRQAGSFDDRRGAEIVRDYLLSEGIESQVRDGASSIDVWVIEETDLNRAREEIADYQSDPTQDKYRSGASRGVEVRQDSERKRRRLEKQQVEISQRWIPPTLADVPVTAGLVLVCWAVAIMTNFGEVDQRGALFDFLRLQSYKPTGWWSEPWRLVTPAFIHFGWIHPLFNSLALFILGTQIEHKRGTVKYVTMIIVLAILSNLAQAYAMDDALRIDPDSAFGGMSGVVYGFIGYAWMKTKYEPRFGIHLSSAFIAYAMFWFVLCFMSPLAIANAAHTVGLVAGLVIGRVTALIRSR